MSDLKGDATKMRLFAAMLDNFIATLACVVLAAKLPGTFSSVARWVIAGMVYLLLFLVQEGLWSATLGKRAFGLKVVRLDGRPAGWRESGWRTTLRILEVNPILLGAIPGGLVVTWSKRKQRLGDMLAHAIVVRRSALISDDVSHA